MATKKTTLDDFEHRYSILMKKYEEGDGPTRLALDEPLNVLENLILAMIRDGWSKRTEQARALTKELKGAATEIRQLKKTIDALVKAAQLGAQTLKTLAAIRTAL